MREYKHTKEAGLVLFLLGAAFSYFAFGKSDLFSVVTLTLLFFLSGLFLGEEMIYNKYDKMHSSGLEDEARKRREKERKLSDEVNKHIKEYEEEHPEN